MNPEEIDCPERRPDPYPPEEASDEDPEVLEDELYGDDGKDEARE